mmetsp:Transcript_30118/g.52024  ORF Transcript_30118/g.52024 Transcript_30118/m.52024 type:complete len:89 (+) Transcript_30118:393-659(+)
MTGLFLLLIPDGASPRSLGGLLPVPVTRSLTVKLKASGQNALEPAALLSLSWQKKHVVYGLNLALVFLPRGPQTALLNKYNVLFSLCH